MARDGCVVLVNKYINVAPITENFLFSPSHLQSSKPHSITLADDFSHHIHDGSQSNRNRTITASSLYWHCTRQAILPPACARDTDTDPSFLLHIEIKTRRLPQPARRCLCFTIPLLLSKARRGPSNTYRKAIPTSSTRPITRKVRPIWRLHHSLTSQMHDPRQLMACRDQVLRNGREKAT